MQPAITINRSTSGSGLAALRRLLARAGIQVIVDRHAVALALVSLLALGPMLQAGYFWGAHDARHSVYFLFEFDRVFRDGVLYPRWFPDMTYGYGYPLFNIYGPLAFYIGEFFHLLGFGFVTAVKIVFALAWVLSGLAMYGFVKRVFENRNAAFIAGLLYVFMPYHLIDVYVRAALAESVALVFLPLTLWAFYNTVEAGRAVILRSGATKNLSSRDVEILRSAQNDSHPIRSILFAAFAYAGMVFAHNGIALLFSIVLAAWILFLVLRTRDSKNRFFSKENILGLIRNVLPTIVGGLLGLGLTGIFMLPLILEYRYINVAQWTQNYYSYQDHFVEPFQLFSPAWGFGISNLGPVDGLSFQLGLVPVILAFFSLFVIAKNPNAKRAYILFFLILTIVVVLLMFDFSLPAWRAFGLASVAQFPWRLLTLTTVSLSVVGGSVMLLDAERVSQIADRLSPIAHRESSSNLQPPTSNFQPPTSNFQPPTSSLQLSVSSYQSPVSNLSTLALAALILLGSFSYITAQIILEPKEGPVSLAGLMAFEQSANEMTGTTIYAQEQPRWSPLADNYMAGKRVNTKIDFSTVPEWLFIRVTRDGIRTTGERVDYNAPNGDATIVFNAQRYPGWRAYLTPSRSSEIVRELLIETEPPYGRIKVTLPQGEHGVMLRFQDTPPRTLGTIISGISLLIAIELLAYDLRAKRAFSQKKFTQ
ncbi:MAG: hypothetical protein HY741_03085 [Chloroflexi bacterium]|nr:hypothetical protein [Chloroflexota bacterium]